MSIAASPIPAKAETQAAPTVRPWLTWTLLASLGAIYAMEVLRPVGGGWKLTPSIETVVAYGALVPDLVFERGEWHRLFTVALLHGGVVHVLMNGLALWSIGPDLERMIGRAWLFVLFFLGAVGGALGSIAVNSTEIVSVGASGAIMCLIAAAFVILFRSRQEKRWDIQWEMLRAVLLSLVPLIYSNGRTGIDGGAHLGGALTGLALGGLLWAIWKDEGPAPRWANPARMLASFGVLLFVIAIHRATTLYEQYARTAGLIPESKMPAADSTIQGEGPGLIRQFPNDPRSHWLQGRVYQLYKVHDLGNAERELRLALADPSLETRFLPQLRRKIEFDLAQLLMDTGRAQEALALAKPFCSTADEYIVSLFKKLCPPAN
jgi:membrane associated rhomboid family serine protease